MKKRLLSFLLVLCMVASIAPFTFATEVPTEKEAFEIMTALKEEYPEGTEWTNDNRYDWNGYSPANGVYWSGGYGCVGFAFLLSDAAFGDLPARELKDITIDDVRVGDILRINNDSHSIIILEVHDDYVIIAEGNYMGTVHWDRKLTADKVAKADYMLTRYPENYSGSAKPALTGWRKAYYDMIQDSIAADENKGWEISNYKLVNLNADQYPELWVDHIIYASGCTLATITENGLYTQLMQSGALSYLEGENLFLHSWGIEGYYADSVYSIENGSFVLIASGTGDTIEGHYSWNGTEMSEAEYIASMDTLVDPSKAKHGHDNPYTYEEFIELLYRLEVEYGPEEDIPTKPESPEPIAGFTDVVPGSFYEDAVVWAVENSITNGKSETEFAPTLDCMRTEVVTFLWRVEGQPFPVTADPAFTDVQPGKFYTDAVTWAVEKNITNGMGDGTFGVSRTCTRAQVVTFLWRTAGSPAPESAECPFTDVVADSFYYDAVLWAVENGITKGMTETEFGVEGNCTRAQIVTFLHRFAG